MNFSALAVAAELGAQIQPGAAGEEYAAEEGPERRWVGQEAEVGRGIGLLAGQAPA